MHFCNCKYKRSLVLSSVRPLRIFSSLAMGFSGPHFKYSLKKRKLLQEILYWIKIIEWKCKERKCVVHGGWKAAGLCDVSDLRWVCYCIMAGSTGSLRRGHSWSVSTATSLAITLQQSCYGPHVWWRTLALSDIYIYQSAIMVHMMQQPICWFSLCALSKISDIILSSKRTWWLFSELFSKNSMAMCHILHHLLLA